MTCTPALCVAMCALPSFAAHRPPGDVCTTRLEIGNANRFRFPVLSRTPTPLLLPSASFPSPVWVSKQFAASGLFPPPLPSFHKPNPIPCLVNGRFALRILRNEWQKPAREQRLLLLHPAAFIATRGRSCRSVPSAEYLLYMNLHR